jgi:hypothetical protein
MTYLRKVSWICMLISPRMRLGFVFCMSQQLQGMPLLQPHQMSGIIESEASWIPVGRVKGCTDFEVVSINHPYNYGSSCGELSASSKRHLNSLVVNFVALNHAVMGLQKREHITLSYPETVRSSSNKRGICEERKKSSWPEAVKSTTRLFAEDCLPYRRDLG